MDNISGLRVRLDVVKSLRRFMKMKPKYDGERVITSVRSVLVKRKKPRRASKAKEGNAMIRAGIERKNLVNEGL